MPLFDKSEALRRARIRLVRRSAVSREEAERVHAREYLAIEGMDRVAQWAKKRGLSIDIHPKIDAGRFHSQARRVEVSSRLGPEKQLIILLHELGHFLIEASGPELLIERFPNGYARIDSGIPGRDVLHKIDVIAEEFEAWHRGWKLAGRLGILIDRDYFDAVRADYLRSYMKWALRRGRPPADDLEEPDEPKV